MLPHSNNIKRLPRSIAGNLLDFILRVAEWVLPKVEFNLELKQHFTQGKVLILSIYSNSESLIEHAALISLAHAADFYVIVVNTGNQKLSIDGEKVNVINRSNKGRDFASYRLGLSQVELEKKELIILMNDSMVWSEDFLSKLFVSNFPKNKSIYGLTLSEQKSHHLQSYLLIFPQDVIDATKIFSDMQIYRFKRTVVKCGELGVSKFWLKTGISLTPILENTTLVQGTMSGVGFHVKDKKDLGNLIRKKRPINPTIHCWPELFRLTGCIKKSLLYKNPAKLLIHPRTLREAEIMASPRIDI